MSGIHHGLVAAGRSFPPPTITGFSPGSRTANTSGNVTISGTNFVSGNTTVTVNGTGYGVTFNSTTSLTVGFPALARGSYPVVVTTPGGSATANYSYTIIPSISSVSPNSVYRNINTTYTLSGSGFTTGSAPFVYVGAPLDQYMTVNAGATDTSCSFTYNFTTAATYPVYIVGYDSWSNAVNITVSNVPTPSITSTSDGRSGNGSLTGSTITLGGSGFAPGVGTTSVSIGGTAVSATVSNTSISFTCPNLSTDGTKTISVTTSGGTATSSVYFWAARNASLVVSTSSSGSYTPPQWANFMDVVVRGGGGGGGCGSGGLGGAWGGGGGAGGGNSTTVNLVSTGFGARSYTVGGGGAGAPANTTAAGSAGGTTSCAGISAVGGAGGCSRCNGTVGAGGGAVTLGLASSPAPTGGGAGNSAQPGANPGSGGGGGNSAFGPYPGITGRAGAVIIAIRQ